MVIFHSFLYVYQRIAIVIGLQMMSSGWHVELPRGLPQLLPPGLGSLCYGRAKGAFGLRGGPGIA